MEKIKHNYLPEDYTPLKRGIDTQREIFKEANIRKEYSIMASCIENILNEISNKIRLKGNIDSLNKINSIIKWYSTMHLKCKVKTEDGYIVNYPIDIDIKVSHNLNLAYRLIIQQLEVLDLI